MPSKQNSYDPETVDPQVQAIIAALTESHRQHGKTPDAEREAAARRQLRFMLVGGKHLPAAYVDSALAYARKAADLKNPGKPA